MARPSHDQGCHPQAACRLQPCRAGTPAPMKLTTKRAVGGAATAVLLAFIPAACGDDEDGDGGTTDEEIQDVEDTAEDLENDVQDEVDSQDEGSNEDGE